MSKMSQAYADSAPARADSAECDLACCRDVMRKLANRIVITTAVIADRYGRRSEIGSDLIERLNEIIIDMRAAAGVELRNVDERD